MKKINIAIDGFSSCGKSTLAKDLAKAIQYNYIDSGAMYRAITLYFLRQNIHIENKDEVLNALKNITLEFGYDQNGISAIFLNGENVNSYIRDLLVADKVSQVAAIKEVREFAVALQKEMITHKGVIMDGRDIGTVVMPDAELKIFVTADPEIRVKRRYLELIQNQPEITIEEVKHNLQMRDYIDMNREESPLRQAEDARILDNSDLNKEQQLQIVLNWFQEIVNASQ